MVKLLIMTHGALADHLLKTMELFISEYQNVEALTLQDDPDAMRDALRRTLLDGGDREFLVLVDLFGGTPFNVAASVIGEATAAGKRIEVISGVNLPMLLEVVPNLEYSTLEELKASAYDMGRFGIRDLMAELGGKS